MKVDMFVVLSVEYEILFSSLDLFYSAVIEDLLRLFFYSAIHYFLKHNYDHVICLLKQPESALFSKEQTTNS